MVSRRLNTETRTYSYRQFCSPRFQSLTVAKKEKEALAFFNKKEIKNVPEKRNARRAKIRGEAELTELFAFSLS